MFKTNSSRSFQLQVHCCALRQLKKTFSHSAVQTLTFTVMLEACVGKFIHYRQISQTFGVQWVFILDYSNRRIENPHYFAIKNPITGSSHTFYLRCFVFL